MAGEKILERFTCCLTKDNPPFYPVEAESFEESDKITGQTSVCIIFGTDEEVDAEVVDFLPATAFEVDIGNGIISKPVAKGTFFFGNGPFVKIQELVLQEPKDLDGFRGCLFKKAVGGKKIKVWGCLEDMFFSL